MSGTMTYQELVNLYGPDKAYEFLRVLEKASGGLKTVIYFDRALRLRYALDAPRRAA